MLSIDQAHSLDHPCECKLISYESYLREASDTVRSLWKKGEGIISTKLDLVQRASPDSPSPSWSMLFYYHAFLSINIQGRDWGHCEQCDRWTCRALNPPLMLIWGARLINCEGSMVWWRIGSTPRSPADKGCSASKLALRVDVPAKQDAPTSARNVWMIIP